MNLTSLKKQKPILDIYVGASKKSHHQIALFFSLTVKNDINISVKLILNNVPILKIHSSTS